MNGVQDLAREDDGDTSSGAQATELSSRSVAVLLLLACTLAYVNAMGGDFVYGDELVVQKNPIVLNPRLWSTLLGLGTGHFAYRPIRTLTYVIDAAIGGPKPWVFHLSNTLYHAAVCIIVYWLACRLGAGKRAAFLAALIFAVHPLHTEDVSYISGRRDLVMALFFLGALICFQSARRRGQSGLRSATAMFGATAALWWLALFSKEMAVTLPALCLLLDVWEGGAQVTRGRVCGYLLFFGGAGLYAIYAIDPATGVTLAVRPLASSHGAMAATMARVFAHELRLWVWPSTLLADYSKDAFPVSAALTDPAGLLALSLHAALIVWGVVEYRRGTVTGLCILSFYATLAPISQVVGHSELASEHSFYLPTVFLAIPTGMALARLRGRGSLGEGFLIAIVALLTIRTVVRNRDWKDALALYSATVRDAPRCARAQCNLALALTGLGGGGDREGPVRLPLFAGCGAGQSLHAQ